MKININDWNSDQLKDYRIKLIVLGFFFFFIAIFCVIGCLSYSSSFLLGLSIVFFVLLSCIIVTIAWFSIRINELGPIEEEQKKSEREKLKQEGAKQLEQQLSKDKLTPQKEAQIHYESKMICSYCGSEILKDAKFCSKCGKAQ